MLLVFVVFQNVANKRLLFILRHSIVLLNFTFTSFLFIIFSVKIVEQWAQKLGFELVSLGDFITRKKDVQEVS